MSEIWKAIPGYMGYEVSCYGNVRSFKRGKCKELSQYVNRNGYFKVMVDGKNVSVHRLVAMAFIPNPDNLPCVNHKDENKKNNHVDNLEWCTVAYNNTYGTSQARFEIARRKRWSPVIATDKEGNEFRFESLKQAADWVGGNAPCIGGCCKHIQGRVWAYGYKWRYENEEKGRFYIERSNALRRKRGKSVVATDKDGNDIYFSTIKEASEKIAIDYRNIIYCCKKRRHFNTAGGYKWRYATKSDIQQYSNLLTI